MISISTCCERQTLIQNKILSLDYPSACGGGVGVSCGNHEADSCAGCPQGNGHHGCNGDCHWIQGSCVLKLGELIEKESYPDHILIGFET